MQELESLVARLESGEMPLEQLLSGYQRGAMLLQFCRDKLQSVEDLTEDYARWYAALVGKIEAKREAIDNLADREAYDHVIGRYTGLLSAIEEKRLGGVVAYGEKLDA